MRLGAYIDQNRTNQYKTLVIIDNNHRHDKIISALKEDGWKSYDVNENILKIIENIPENKVKVRIGKKIVTIQPSFFHSCLSTQ